jgi:hypothetical protein
MPERRLEHHLRERSGRPVRAFSVGASGYGQDQELLALRRYLRRYRADHVVVWLTLNNDVKDNTWPTFGAIDGRPKPTFWLEEGEPGPSSGRRLAGPDHPMGGRVGPPIRLAALLELAVGGSPDAEWADRRLPPPYRPLSESEAAAGGDPIRDDWQELVDQGLMLPRTLAMETNDRALRLAPVSERSRYGIELTRELLLTMRGLAAERGAGFTLMAVDTGDKDGEIDGVYRVDGALYRASSEQFWRNVDAIAAGFDYHLLPITEPLWQAGRLDHHLNEHATDEVMRALAERLIADGRLADSTRRLHAAGATPDPERGF